MSERYVVTGLAAVTPSPDEDFAAAVDPVAFLKIRKSRKYLAPQDDLAVVAAGRALASAGLDATHLGARAGLAMCVGFLSFDRKDTDPVLALSVEDGRFSMTRFAAEGMRKTHPLLTFRCLPNMPAYHVSVNFALRGPYFATYPGVAQAYEALARAAQWLDDDEADIVVVGAAAHQRNFLVEHHLGRVPHREPLERLRDAGAVLVIERESGARARARGAGAGVAERARPRIHSARFV
jgi:3-oxoacyl-(acyl-carrier-protein) synthase